MRPNIRFYCRGWGVPLVQPGPQYRTTLTISLDSWFLARVAGTDGRSIRDVFQLDLRSDPSPGLLVPWGVHGRTGIARAPPRARSWRVQCWRDPSTQPDRPDFGGVVGSTRLALECPSSTRGD